MQKKSEGENLQIHVGKKRERMTYLKQIKVIDLVLNYVPEISEFTKSNKYQTYYNS